MGQRELVVPQRLVDPSGCGVILAIEHLRVLEIDAGEAALDQLLGARQVAAVEGDPRGDAEDERFPARGLPVIGERQRLVGGRLGGGERMLLCQGAGEVGQDAHLQQHAVEFARLHQREAVGGHGFRIALLLAQDLRPVVVHGQRQRGVAAEHVVRLVEIAERAVIIAGVEIDHPDVLQRHGLAARHLGGAEHVMGALIVVQRLQIVAERCGDRAVRAQHVAIELGVWRDPLDGGERPVDQRLRLGEPIGEEQGLAVQPFGGGDRDGGAGRERQVMRQRDGGVGRRQRPLGIALHRLLGLLDAAVERLVAGGRLGLGGLRRKRRRG